MPTGHTVVETSVVENGARFLGEEGGEATGKGSES